jgi:MFS family permease
MTAPIYGVALAITVPMAWLADRYPKKRGLLLVIVMFCGAVFSALAAGIYDNVARYVLLCFMNAAIWTGNCLGISFASTSLAEADTEVRAIALALVNGLGAAAQLYGSHLFPANEGPKYTIGFSVFAACFAAGSVLYGAAYLLFPKYPFTRSQSLDNEE